MMMRWRPGISTTQQLHYIHVAILIIYFIYFKLIIILDWPGSINKDDDIISHRIFLFGISYFMKI